MARCNSVRKKFKSVQFINSELKSYEVVILRVRDLNRAFYRSINILKK